MSRARLLRTPLVRLLAAALLLAPAVAAGQEPASAPGPAAAPAAAAQEPGARDRLEKRILRLSNGRIVRALSRWTGNGWEIRRDGAWVALEEGSVLSWRSLSELSKERARRAREVGAGDHQARVELAEWMLEEGLIEEALAELDRVLRDEPDHPAALEVIRSAPFSRPNGGDPRAEPKLYATRLIGAAVSAGPARRELCILSLGALAETEEGLETLRAALARELVSYRVLRRTFAAHALRRLLPGEQVYELLRRCALDTSRPVREESARALHDTGEPGIVVPLVKALSSESRAVRTNAAESLGNAGFPAAVPALVAHFSRLPVAAGSSGTRPPAAHIHISTEYAYVGDYDVEIAQGASIADPIVMHVQDAVVLDARSGGISGYTKVTEYKVVRGALEKLTGAERGRSQEDWEHWYEENRQRFAPNTGAPATPSGR